MTANEMFLLLYIARNSDYHVSEEINKFLNEFPFRMLDHLDKMSDIEVGHNGKMYKVNFFNEDVSLEIMDLYEDGRVKTAKSLNIDCSMRQNCSPVTLREYLVGKEGHVQATNQIKANIS